VRHRNDVWHLGDVAEFAAFLTGQQVEASQITVPQTGLPDGEDGCE
jgi:hypothetical protein